MVVWYLLLCNQNSRSHDMGEFPYSVFDLCQDLLWPLFLCWHVEHSVCVCLMPNMTHLPTKTWDSLLIKTVISLQIFSRLLSAPPYWCLQVTLARITAASICCTPNGYQTLLRALHTLSRNIFSSVLRTGCWRQTGTLIRPALLNQKLEEPESLTSEPHMLWCLICRDLYWVTDLRS